MGEGFLIRAGCLVALAQEVREYDGRMEVNSGIKTVKIQEQS